MESGAVSANHCSHYQSHQMWLQAIVNKHEMNNTSPASKLQFLQGLSGNSLRFLEIAVIHIDQFRKKYFIKQANLKSTKTVEEFSQLSCYVACTVTRLHKYSSS